MKTLMVGAGAVGGFVGGRLVQAGREVDFLVRPGRAGHLRERGLRIVDGDRAERIAVNPITADALKGTQEPYGLVLLSVKPDALSAVMDDIAPVVGSATVLIPFLNGMTHLEKLTGRFGESLVGGTLRIVTQLDDNQDIRQYAPGGQIEIGELDGRRSSRVEEVAETLTIPDFSVTVSTDIIGAMWQKWVMIATVGAITSLARGTIGDAAALTDGERFATVTLEEAATVAAASGHGLGEPAHAALHQLVTATGSGMTSSLSRELASGRPTEVENVLGDLVRRGHAAGVAVPRLEAAALTLRAHNRRLTAAPGE
ncbi:ketopantoate reductase family protein [Streptomyces liangshanensis]|uniref:ketopantoate reductase family protein n=1 Tax=Streptomyces liangshanensis TaxID=2717324 RepID=UPI0036DB4DB4